MKDTASKKPLLLSVFLEIYLIMCSKRTYSYRKTILVGTISGKKIDRSFAARCFRQSRGLFVKANYEVGYVSFQRLNKSSPLVLTRTNVNYHRYQKREESNKVHYCISN